MNDFVKCYLCYFIGVLCGLIYGLWIGYCEFSPGSPNRSKDLPVYDGGVRETRLQEKKQEWMKEVQP